MTHNTLRWVSLLAVISITGLVIMLIADAVLWDRLGFVLTALPLIVGLGCYLRARRTPVASRVDRELLIETETE